MVKLWALDSISTRGDINLFPHSHTTDAGHFLPGGLESLSRRRARPFTAAGESFRTCAWRRVAVGWFDLVHQGANAGDR